MENKLLETPELCYEHIGDKINAKFYKVADNSYYMVIVEQDEKLRNCNYPKIKVYADKYPRYIKYSDELFLRGKDKDRDYNPVALDYESFNSVKYKLNKLENATKTIDIEINCNINTLGSNETLDYYDDVIENEDDIEELIDFLEKLINRLKQEIKK